MEESENSGGRLVRTALALALGVLAINSLQKGKRVSGAVAGIGALALGYTAASGSKGVEVTFDADATTEDGELRCSICGQPIRPGQRRGPDANNEIAHEACKVSAE